MIRRSNQPGPTIDVFGKILVIGREKVWVRVRERGMKRGGWRKRLQAKQFGEQVQNITHNCFGHFHISHIILGISLKPLFHRMGLWETPARTQGVTTIQTKRTTVVWTLLSATKVTLATLLLTSRGSPQSRLQGGLFCYRQWQRGEIIFYGSINQLRWNKACCYYMQSTGKAASWQISLTGKRGKHLNSIATSQSTIWKWLVELTNSDDKIQISLLILRRVALIV